ncbi:hypothetical protein FRC0036_02152 [Corynebacterium diphtheriae]|nr:hypothetical protein CIP101352_02326 [Corynebacterium diphtheriae]CAB0571378.1 hypothetical protein CIP107527_02233 [Corynebacterium diphtheriae]CAB0573186.1 hypothetical protein CIP107509_02208 [Corynebacterium diphtheriae]CAB0590660.1 hypothetical protein CIP107549_00738 [Corynebacterium diphtheriae]CAB0614691.1 hypothetical protein CIP107555_01924 [Corynebacterium diphtheriae]
MLKAVVRRESVPLAGVTRVILTITGGVGIARKMQQRRFPSAFRGVSFWHDVDSEECQSQENETLSNPRIDPYLEAANGNEKNALAPYC